MCQPVLNLIQHILYRITDDDDSYIYRTYTLSYNRGNYWNIFLMGYGTQLHTIKRLKVPEGITKRYNCPFCGGYNTLGVSNISGIISWHCFKASCGARGIHEEGRSLDGIKASLSRISDSSKGLRIGAAIPELLSHNLHAEHIEWLKTVNTYEAYENRLVEIMYSPTTERLLFSTNNGKGWIGKRFGKFGPKWLKFGDLTHLFACGTGQTGVLVEDAPSACAVGVIPEYTGLALLSTNLTTQHTLDLAPYDEILVCLDPDASIKSLNIAKRLYGIKPVRTVFIPDDLKYYNPIQIKEILK